MNHWRENTFLKSLVLGLKDLCDKCDSRAPPAMVSAFLAMLDLTDYIKSILAFKK